MAALVNQTNVNVDLSFFTPASSTLGAGLGAATSTLNVSTATFYGGGGTIQPGGGAGTPNVGLKLQDYPPDTCGPSTLTVLTESNTPGFIAANAVYFSGGGSIIAPSTNVLTFNGKSVACIACSADNVSLITSSINGTTLLNPNPRVSFLGIQQGLDAGGSTIVTLANTSTISLAVNAVGAVPTIVPYAVYTDPAGSYTLYGDPLAVVSYVTTFLTV
jgi:hypothetical protein